MHICCRGADTRTRPLHSLLQVLVAEVAGSELERCTRFLRHISHCAAKLQLGVNFSSNLPSLDRWGHYCVPCCPNSWHCSC